MKTKHTLLAGYNAQAVVTDDQVIVGALLTQAPTDQNLLHPTLDACRAQLTAAGIDPALLHTVLVDAGYANEDTFARAHQQNLRLLAPLTKDTRALRDGADPTGERNLHRHPATAAAQHHLAAATHNLRKLHRHRPAR
jgi:hypothetical protein